MSKIITIKTWTCWGYPQLANHLKEELFELIDDSFSYNITTEASFEKSISVTVTDNNGQVRNLYQKTPTDDLPNFTELAADIADDLSKK